MSITMPETIAYGKVVGRFIQAVGDTDDADKLPDVVPVQGNISFTPANPLTKETGVVPPTTVIRSTITCTLNSEGLLTSPAGDVGVWLVAGVYKVAYSTQGAAIPGHDILVLPEHDNVTPLDLTIALPPGGPVLTASQYAELSARIDALGGGSGGAVDSVNGETGVVVLDVTDIGAATAAQGAKADTAVQPDDLTAYATDAELTAGLETKANTAHTHTSASVPDFVEAVQDALAGFFNVTGATFTYDDANNQLVVTVPPDTNTTDPEAVRDAIGAAMIGVGNIVVTVNDALDTITISTTATANSTDAALRDRSTHTGTQDLATITGTGDAAAKNTGTTAGTVAAGNDSRITGAAQKSANLSDLANAGTARANLGLGTAATTEATAYATAAQGAAADDALPAASAPELIRDTMATALVAGANVTITPNDGADTITIAASGGGGGGGEDFTYAAATIPYVGRWYTHSSAGLSNNRSIPAEMVLIPFRCPRSFTADRIALGVATVHATTQVRLGIYNARTDGMPGTVLLDAGTVGVASLGEQSIAISQALTGGVMYWLATTADVINSPAKGYGTAANAQYGGSPDLGRPSITAGNSADGIFFNRTGGVGDGAAFIDLTGRTDHIFAGGYATPFLRVGAV